MHRGGPGRKGRTYSAAVACVEGFGYPLEIHEDGTDLRFWCRTAEGVQVGQHDWRSQMVIHEDSRLIRLFVFTDILYPDPGRRLWMAEMVCRLNEGLVSGSFDFAWDSGDVHFRNALDLRGQEPTPQAVERFLGLIAYPFSIWIHASKHFWKAQVSPRAAVEAARIAADTWESEAVSEGARRALIRLC